VCIRCQYIQSCYPYPVYKSGCVWFSPSCSTGLAYRIFLNVTILTIEGELVSNLPVVLFPPFHCHHPCTYFLQMLKWSAGEIWPPLAHIVMLRLSGRQTGRPRDPGRWPLGWGVGTQTSSPQGVEVQGSQRTSYGGVRHFKLREELFKRFLRVYLYWGVYLCYREVAELMSWVESGRKDQCVTGAPLPESTSVPTFNAARCVPHTTPSGDTEKHGQSVAAPVIIILPIVNALSRRTPQHLFHLNNFVLSCVQISKKGICFVWN
jgi:hypothetical protein